MKRLLLLAGLALVLFPSAPSIANGWVRNPADSLAALRQGLWRIWDVTDSLGDPIEVFLSTPAVYSSADGSAVILMKCRPRFISVTVTPAESFISFGDSPMLPAKIDGVRYSLSVKHETSKNIFVMGELEHPLFRRAIQEELPVKIAVPIHRGPNEVFEWDMKGGAAAWEEACP